MKELDKIIKELHPLEVKVILAFETKEELTGEEIINITQLSESDYRRAVGWLKIKKLVDVTLQSAKTYVYLSELGKKYLKNGTPEKQIIEKIKVEGHVIIQNIDFLEPLELSEAIGFLKGKGIIEIKKGGVVIFKDKSNLKAVERLDELIVKAETGIILEFLADEDRQIIEERYRERVKSRGVFEVVRKTLYTLKITEKGKQLMNIFQEEKLPQEQVSQLTPELIRDGGWREKEFREYNVELRPPRVIIGRPHPYQQFLNSVRAKLISMGFCEMTGELVESEFWNMDALFMPQSHPAREIHGIYFVKSPKYAKEIAPTILEKVSKTHEDGWHTHSLGWRYKFDKKKASRLILRSHGTALSVRTLASQPEPPGKYFAIARCFRPDPVDITHAPDFFQIEGIVVSENVNFGSLLGLLELFGTEIAGADEIKFTPGYFPFTEPSAELHVKHPKLGWVELGGAGIFRPEVTLPLGVKVPVLAWGLGLDRMAMVVLNIHDIRDLFSRDLEFMRKIVF